MVKIQSANHRHNNNTQDSHGCDAEALPLLGSGFRIFPLINEKVVSVARSGVSQYEKFVTKFSWLVFHVLSKSNSGFDGNHPLINGNFPVRLEMAVTSIDNLVVQWFDPEEPVIVGSAFFSFIFFIFSDIREMKRPEDCFKSVLGHGVLGEGEVEWPLSPPIVCPCVHMD